MVIAPDGLLLGQDQDEVAGRFQDVQRLRGDLAELRFWDSALSPSQIPSGVGGFLTGNEARLIAYYQFDTVSGSPLADLSGNGRDATFGGAATATIAGVLASNSFDAIPRPARGVYRPAPSISSVGDATGDGLDDFAVTSAARGEVYVIPGTQSTYAGLVPPPAVVVPEPLSAWTFNEDASDVVGTSDGNLFNGARIEDGGLVLDGVNDYLRTLPVGADLNQKTLVAWVSADNLTQRSGGVLSVEDATGADRFDAIVFGERTARQWMNGSEFFNRTPFVNNFSALETQVAPREVMIAVQYYASTGLIRIFRDGVQISSMIVAEADFAAGDADVLMGLRHLDRATEVGTAAGTDAFFAGGVNEARLYDVALSADQIAALAAIGPDTGRTRIDQIQGISTLKASHDLTGMAVHGAGFVDGTTLPGGGVNRGLPDILITAADRSIFTDDDLAHKRLSYLVSGESLGTSVNLDTDAVTVGLGAMHGVGDINRDGFDDLAVATFEPGPALEGVNTFSHQVIQLFAGGDDVGARLAGGAPDFVFEPDVAQFVQSETSEPLVPKGLAFAGAGFTGGTRLITSIDLQSGNADLVGNWVAVDDAASVGGNLLVTDAADPNAAARWEFEGLDSTRNYIVRVSVTDLAALGRVPAAVSEYFIDGAEEETVVVPAGTPVDVTSPAGTTFIQLGSFRPDGDGTLKITLGAQADIPAFPE